MLNQALHQLHGVSTLTEQQIGKGTQRERFRSKRIVTRLRMSIIKGEHCAVPLHSQGRLIPDKGSELGLFLGENMRQRIEPAAQVPEMVKHIVTRTIRVYGHVKAGLHI